MTEKRKKKRLYIKPHATNSDKQYANEVRATDEHCWSWLIVAYIFKQTIKMYSILFAGWI